MYPSDSLFSVGAEPNHVTETWPQRVTLFASQGQPPQYCSKVATPKCIYGDIGMPLLNGTALQHVNSPMRWPRSLHAKGSATWSRPYTDLDYTRLSCLGILMCTECNESRNNRKHLMHILTDTNVVTWAHAARARSFHTNLVYPTWILSAF
jgi:hypothetical protein